MTQLNHHAAATFPYGATEEERRGVMIRHLELIDCTDMKQEPLGSLIEYEQQGFVYANRK